MSRSISVAPAGLGAQLLLWSAMRLPPTPAPRPAGAPLRGPLKSVRKGKG